MFAGYVSCTAPATWNASWHTLFRTRGVFDILTSKCVSRHSRAHFFHLTSTLPSIIMWQLHSTPWKHCNFHLTSANVIQFEWEVWLLVKLIVTWFPHIILTSHLLYMLQTALIAFYYSTFSHVETLTFVPNCSDSRCETQGVSGDIPRMAPLPQVLIHWMPFRTAALLPRSCCKGSDSNEEQGILGTWHIG
jgi:hypothetical protein